jgi:FtsH-binding integral membrane protein
MKKKKDSTLSEMIIGMICWGIIIQILLLVFFENILYNAIGLWCGVVISIAMAVHMRESIEEALNYTEKYAKKKMQADSAKRMTLAAIVMGVVFYLKIGNPLTVLAGIFALKVSAYAQPLMHKMIQKIKKS